MRDPGSDDRSGGRILVEQLVVHGVRRAYCVPGESYLDALDALRDADVTLSVCRQEGGAAMMAEAEGKLTGRPGVCLVTRGPGATNASAGVHVARQDSTPMLLLVGQVGRDTRGREGFQEIDVAAAFAPLAKWATEVDAIARIPEVISRAFHVALSGRPGPVVVALPEDVLSGRARVADARPCTVAEPAPTRETLDALLARLALSRRPVVIAGGSRWTEAAVHDLVRLAERLALPVATSFRRQALFPASHPNAAGDLGIAAEPALLDLVRDADLVLLVGGRLSEMPSQGWTLLDIPAPGQALVHVHPGAEELGRVYRADIPINATPGAFLAALHARLDAGADANEGDGAAPATTATARGEDRAARLPAAPNAGADTVTGAAAEPLRAARERRLATRRAERARWIAPQASGAAPRFDLGAAVRHVAERLGAEAIICNGAGNYAGWVHRHYPFERFGSQLAPTSGSMGYGLPAAIAAARAEPARRAVAFAGDGCFLMTGQELATAVQYALPVIVVVVDNGMYGTIRMHQERHYPGRVVGTDLVNPDFVAYARAFGARGERVETTPEFAPAFERALAAEGPALLHCIADPEAISVGRTLSEIRDAPAR